MKHIITIAITFVILTLSSCEKYLDQVPQEILNEKTLFEKRDNLIRLLTQAYSGVFIPEDFFHKAIGGCGDEATYIWTGYDAYLFDNCTYSQSNNIYDIWQSMYAKIRICHYFLGNIDKCKDEKLSEDDRTWWKGEAEFLMAYFYFLLMTEYGPVPIVDPNNYSVDAILTSINKNEGVSRPTFDEQVDYIDKLLVDAASKLDISYKKSNSARAARANATAAKFLRARLWLYAASPLYNGLLNPATGVSFPQLMIKNKDGKNLLPASPEASKWAKAVEYCKDAMTTAAQGGYKMIDKEGSGFDNYKKNFTVPRGGAPGDECIYYLQAVSSGDLINIGLPLSWAGYSGFCPTQEHVDEYFTAKGLSPNDDPDWVNASGFYSYKSSRENGGFDIKILNKFTKRDPRFYCNILFPGQCSYAMLDGTTESTDKSWAKEPTKDKNWYRPWVEGQDGFGAKAGNDYTINGYLCCKWIQTDASSSSRGDNMVAIFRYSELVLNLIESAFENDVVKRADPLSDNDIFTNWDMLRDRVGLPHVKTAYEAAGIPLTIPKLRELIRNERRVELAFEGHRYFDNRRWLDAQREKGPKHGFSILSAENGGFWNQVPYINVVFYDKKYFVPIPQDEINKNPALSQNPLW